MARLMMIFRMSAPIVTHLERGMLRSRKREPWFRLGSRRRRLNQDQKQVVRILDNCGADGRAATGRQFDWRATGRHHVSARPDHGLDGRVEVADLQLQTRRTWILDPSLDAAAGLLELNELDHQVRS